MDPLASLVIIVPLLAFWGWMFWDLAGNNRIAANVKYTWALAFVVGNVFTAVYYFVVEYRKRY